VEIKMIKLLDIKQIFVDERLYPRSQWSWQTSYDYQQSMKVGAKFPPIVVNEYADKYYLIDGMHRMKAYLSNKVESIQCEVLKLESMEAMFKECVARNIGNGRPLSCQDKALIIGKLKSMDISLPEISIIVQMPIDKVEQFVAQRITNSITGEEIYIKSPLIDITSEIGTDFNELQRVFSATSEQQIISQFRRLLEIKTLNLKNPTILNDLKIIRKLIEKIVLGKYKK